MVSPATVHNFEEQKIVWPHYLKHIFALCQFHLKSVQSLMNHTILFLTLN